MSEPNRQTSEASTPSDQDSTNNTNNQAESAQPTHRQNPIIVPIVVLGSSHTPEPESPPANEPKDCSELPTHPNPSLLQPPTETVSGSSSTPATTSSSAANSPAASTPTSTQEAPASYPASMSSSSSSPGNTSTSGGAGSTTGSASNPGYHLPYAPFPFRMPDGAPARGSAGNSPGSAGRGK